MDVARTPIVQRFRCLNYYTTYPILQTCTSSKSFQSTPNAITRAFAMTGGKKMPLRRNTKVIFMISQVKEIFLILILASGTICEMNDLVDIWINFFDVVNHNF